MKTNFSFLQEKEEFEMFAAACIDAENVAKSAPALSVTGSRKALELAVKWVYAADKYMTLPYGRYTLQDLLHERCFTDEVDADIRSRMQYIVRMGNFGIHTNNKYTSGDAILSLSILFDFIEWIDYCYGMEYEERSFDEAIIPSGGDEDRASVKRLEEEMDRKEKETSQLIDQKDKEIEALLKKIKEQSEELSKSKTEHKKKRKYTPQDLSEYETRKRYIDADLKLLGWEFSNERKQNCIEIEYEVHGMPKDKSDDSKGRGFVDYVIYGDNGDIIAIIEAKRTSYDAKKGTVQAELYHDCIKKKSGKSPIIFNTNGFETYIWDKEEGSQRKVSGLFNKNDIMHLINQRESRRPLKDLSIDEKIAGRHYQLAAVRAVCDNIEKGNRSSLLVMATGTGKTRVAASITDILTRGGYVTNVLFLADRKALVRQAKASFAQHLGEKYTYCNLVENKDDKNSRIVFSTYPTMLNAINAEKRVGGEDTLFSEGHFDLIFIDEAHRSIFNKYKALFDYFDSYVVGLTATPKDMDVASTYKFFKVPSNMPTYVYTYDEAIDPDKYLVPYHNIEVTTEMMDEGIHYDDLSEAEQEAYEEEFMDENENLEDFQPPEKINKIIFNQNTVDMVLNDIMTNGLKDAGGNKIGKTIVFAQNRNHAKFIVERFNALYPEYKGDFCRYVTYSEDYSDNLIERFKNPDGEPTIIVSIDMMDTGVDVPEVVNLVFFKQVRSRIKFWQMIGRGTRTCPDLFGPGRDKTEFYIFDYLRNFEFFRESKNGKETDVVDTVASMIFRNRVSLVSNLQHVNYISDEYQEFRDELVDKVYKQIKSLESERIDVKQNRRYVEKFKEKVKFENLSDVDVTELHIYIAPLINEAGEDDDALSFDNLMYSIMLGKIRQGKSPKKFVTFVKNRAEILLSKKMTIPAVKAKSEYLKKVVDDNFWLSSSILEFEALRKELRDIMKFAKGEPGKIHYTEFEDTWTERSVDVPFETDNKFEDYEKKVNAYFTTHANSIPVHKLRCNKPLSEVEYKELNRILTEELGTKEDYERVFADTPLGKLVRKIVKMDHETVMEIFASYIDEQKWNSNQIAFVKTLISYIEEHGYIEDMGTLLKPPFDRPMLFTQLYDNEEDTKRIIDLVKSINENAVNLVG